MCDINPIPPRKCAKVEILIREGYSGAEITQKVGVTNKEKNESWDTLAPKRSGRCGRHKKTSPRIDWILARECKRNRKASSRQLQVVMEQHGVFVSSRTVGKRLLDSGLRARRPLKKQKLTNMMITKRLELAKGKTV